MKTQLNRNAHNALRSSLGNTWLQIKAFTIIKLPLFQVFPGLREPIFLEIYTIIKASSPQPAFTCSKLTIETLEQGVKYVQS